MAAHQNNGHCPHCQQIIARYPGINPGLKKFFEDLQAKHPEAHISCAGRGKADQEDCVRRGVSRAHWTQSAHNWNMAMDFFRNDGKNADMYTKSWFQSVINPAVEQSAHTCGVQLQWYGAPGSEFYELPHVQVANWRALAHTGKAHLVE